MPQILEIGGIAHEWQETEDQECDKCSLMGPNGCVLDERSEDCSEGPGRYIRETLVDLVVLVNIKKHPAFNNCIHCCFYDNRECSSPSGIDCNNGFYMSLKDSEVIKIKEPYVKDND